jgi:hypothetical protein
MLRDFYIYFLIPPASSCFYKHQMWAEGGMALPLAVLSGLSSERNPK